MTKNKKPLVVLSAGHAFVDVYQGTVAALVPFLVAERAYGYAAASGIVLAASLLSSVIQPLFGVLTDRWAMPWLIPVSTAAAGAGIALAGVSGSYLTTLAAVALSGLGVAAYHPEAARLARALGGGGGHTAMSWFALGGNVGFACSPLLVTAVVGTGGLAASPLLAAPAALGAVLSVMALRTHPLSRTIAAPAGAGPVTENRRAFCRLSLVVVCRSVAFVGLSTFIALYARERTNGGDTAGAVALFVLFAGSALGTVLGGRLAARWGRVRVTCCAYAATVPAVAGVVFLPGPALYAGVALAAVGLYLPFSLQVTLAQDYLPARVGTASGLTLGLTVSVGGLAGPLIGAVADATSLRTALVPLIVMPALAWLLARALPEPAAVEPVGPSRPPRAGVRQR